MLLRITALITIMSLLGGCAAPLVIAGGAAAAGVVVAKDRRTAGTMLDDENIELATQQRIAQEPELLENTHVSVTSYNGVVLLTGEVQLPAHKQRIAQLARQHIKVRELRNQLEVGAIADAASRNRDTMLTGRVKSRLINTQGIPSSAFKVVSDKGTVYLMGLVSHKEAAQAVDIARTTQGVQRIVKIFEYTD